MVELDGIEYTERTPLENAYDMIAYINTYCTENNVVNTKGEVVQIDINPGNPLFLILFGFAYLVSVLQHLLISCANSFNVGRATDKQLLNIAEAANIRRIAPTKTTMSVFVTCPIDSTDPCSITEDLSISYMSGTLSITLHPIVSTIIQPGEGALVVMQAEDYTAMSIPENSITSFDANPDNMGTFYNYASVPAHAIETIANLRSRIQKRQDSTGRIDQAIDAIRGLEGVVQCNIFYNYDYVNPVTQAEVSVPPRQALVIVQGYNNNIARAFYSHLACLTAGESRLDAIRQDFVTKAGQAIPFFIIPPTFVPLRIQVIARTQLDDKYWASVQSAIQQYIASRMVIAQELTAVELSSLLVNKYPDLPLVALHVYRLTNGLPEEIGERIFTRPFELLTVNIENISRGIAAINDY